MADFIIEENRQYIVESWAIRRKVTVIRKSTLQGWWICENDDGSKIPVLEEQFVRPVTE